MPVSIGIIRESKIPPDNRAPLTPRQCQDLKEKYNGLKIQVEWSPVRCFTDDDYKNFGIEVVENVDCDILFGIKEVAREKLIPGKTYFFFSHTIKKQPHNREMLRNILAKRITLIDYELLTDDQGNRIIGFGRWAGIIGAHYGLMMLGRKTGAYHLKPAFECVNMQEVIDQYENVSFTPAKIVITGSGRVATGALEVMHAAEIKEVTQKEFLENEFPHPVYVQLRSKDMYKRKDGKPFNHDDFHKHPGEYENAFKEFLKAADVLINCIYWDPRAPRLFEEDDTQMPEFRMKTISDISCDINGSVPITYKATFSEDPIYGYHPETRKPGKPFLKDTIDIMAVSNLPNELPRDASRDFGQILMNTVIPELLKSPDSALFERATITKDGKLTARFQYLSDYAGEGNQELNGN